jgi:hypothetical protein
MVGAGAGPTATNGASAAARSPPRSTRRINDAYARAMRDAGYDPDNPLSVLAYRASGKDIARHLGALQTQRPRSSGRAIKYADDPQKYVESIDGNAA